MTSTSTELEPTPVFVDQTGLRGRRLRGLGWLVGILCAGCVVAMISGLVGTQSQAPALTVPRTADTTPPSQYLNAPLPAAPGAAAQPVRSTAAAVPPSVVTESVPATTVPGATAPGTAATATAATVTAAPVTVASSPVTVTAQ
ncbi:hypothetical protein [Streptomyces sp. NPDC001675]